MGPGASSSNPYKEHLTEVAATALLAGGLAFEGSLRINSRRREQAYVSLPGLGCDVLFDGLRAQNRGVRARARAEGCPVRHLG
jgi:hypothetical protein